VITGGIRLELPFLDLLQKSGKAVLRLVFHVAVRRGAEIHHSIRLLLAHDGKAQKKEKNGETHARLTHEAKRPSPPLPRNLSLCPNWEEVASLRSSALDIFPLSCPRRHPSFVNALTVSVSARQVLPENHHPIAPMIKHALILTVAACAALTSCQSGKTNHAACADMPPYKGSAAFERMKSLVGKWSGESPEMGTMNTEFRLIAGDSVIEERFAEGTPMEMLSTYHDVNGKLTMTHYCMLRNQPRMRLVKSPPTR
jgi:hypothetical protein